jgi:hypothetical protein
MLKMGLDASGVYLENRMRYYEQTLKNPDGLKIMKLSVEQMGGKTMSAVAGT